jgi:NAD(P)-dependent dehydrogenase (short-subunit alcohol dehydrogenase family)
VEARSVLITGTTSGLGRGLLQHYAREQLRVISVNRRRIPELERQHPSVRFECVDVRSADGVERLVRELEASGELPDLFILNAGMNRLDNDAPFDLSAYREVMDTNLFGVLNFIAPLSALPATSVERHIVAISSMVKYAGNPHGLGYTTSKRAVTACFDVWARMYAGTDLVFQQVMLGPVATDIYTMADRFPAWMSRVKDLSSASIEGATVAISRFARTRKKKLIYPVRALPLFGAMWVGQRLVPRFLGGRKALDERRRRSANQR